MNYLEHIEHDSRRFREAARAAPAGMPVPSCPGWDAAELVWHLAEVQLFWADIVARRLQSPDDVMKPERPSGYAATLQLAERAAGELLAALEAADPAEAVWTWAGDQTAGFVLRRQAHEALIHRVDAELTAGGVSEVDAALAADGVDEMTEYFVAGQLPDWSTFTPDGTTVRLETVDAAQSWSLVLGRFQGTSPVSGNTYDLDAAQAATGDTENVIRGTAAALDLWLWGRGDISHIDVTGDPSVAARLRAIAAEGTQ